MCSGIACQTCALPRLEGCSSTALGDPQPSAPLQPPTAAAAAAGGAAGGAAAAELLPQLPLMPLTTAACFATRGSHKRGGILAGRAMASSLSVGRYWPAGLLFGTVVLAASVLWCLWPLARLSFCCTPLRSRIFERD